MVNPIAWIDAVEPISKDSADVIAASLGGRLLIHPEPADLSRLADIADREEIPFWWAGRAANGTTAISQLIVEFTSGRVSGTAGDDLFFGAQGHNKLQASAGDDIYLGGAGGGSIDLGAGNDRLYLGETIDAPPWTNFSAIPLTRIFDGAGNDIIDAPAADVIASIDGDNDIFMNLHKLAYLNATGDLHAADGVVTGGGVGTDMVSNTSEFSGGAGNDDIADFATIYGGAGNDVLRPGGVIAQRFPEPAYGAIADGGDGDDILYSSALARAELRGGNGDDIFILSETARASGGSGNDQYIFKDVVQVNIFDWTVGDRIDLSALVDGSLASLFADGYLNIRHNNGYTEIRVDHDGGGDSFDVVANLKGVFSQTTIDDWIFV